MVNEGELELMLCFRIHGFFPNPFFLFKFSYLHTVIVGKQKLKSSTQITEHLKGNQHDELANTTTSRCLLVQEHLLLLNRNTTHH